MRTNIELFCPINVNFTKREQINILNKIIREKGILRNVGILEEWFNHMNLNNKGDNHMTFISVNELINKEMNLFPFEYTYQSF